MTRMIVPGDAAPKGLTDDELVAWRADTALIIPDLGVAGVCPGDTVDVADEFVDQLEAQGWTPAPKPTRSKKTPDASAEPEEATE